MSGPSRIANPATMNEVEALLLQHPYVVAASLINEEGLDGHAYPVAYVVPHAERMNEAKAQLYHADKDKRVAQWRKAFDHVYRFTPGAHAPTFVGWTSSYTNKPLPDADMREWLDCTVARIMLLGPQKVLEIGCGVGLLVQELAPQCAVYRGTDLSPTGLGRLREFVASKPELRHVELLEREATDLDDQPPGSVDTVVINSVAQYFPDLRYLRTVLEGAVRLVSSGGRVFIGDVRHLGLLSLFHTAVQLAKAPPTATARWLKRKIALATEQERELVIDPQFFTDLPRSIPRISSVDILLKRGQAHNELTRYRYDVVLHVGETTSTPSRLETEWQIGDQSVADIVTRFDAQQLESVTIRDVPNRRLASDIASMRRLSSADDWQLVEDIRSPAAAEIDLGRDPEDFWNLADTPRHDVTIGWSPSSAEGHFDVLLGTREGCPGSPKLRQATRMAQNPQRTCLATDPLGVIFRQQLGIELQHLLNGHLPGSQLPSAVLVVNGL